MTSTFLGSGFYHLFSHKQPLSTHKHASHQYTTTVSEVLKHGSKCWIKPNADSSSFHVTSEHPPELWLPPFQWIQPTVLLHKHNLRRGSAGRETQRRMMGTVNHDEERGCPHVRIVIFFRHCSPDEPECDKNLFQRTTFTEQREVLCQLY